MISTAFTLSILTTSAFVIVYNKLPRRIRRLIEKHDLITDVFALITVYMLFGGTLTALIAGGFTGLLVSSLLHIVNNKEEFLYLWDLKSFIKENLTIAKGVLNDFGTKYRKKRLLALS